MAAETDDLFVAADEEGTGVRRRLEESFGGSFEPTADGNPVLSVDQRTGIYVGPHEFGSAPLQEPDGTWVDLPDAYHLWIQVRNMDRDADLQMLISRRVFGVLKSAGRWKVLLTHDLERIIDRYDPDQAN